MLRWEFCDTHPAKRNLQVPKISISILFQIKVHQTILLEFLSIRYTKKVNPGEEEQLYPR